MDTVIYIICAVLAAIVVFLVYYIVKPEASEPDVRKDVTSKGGVISVSYKSEKGRSFEVHIHPDMFEEEQEPEPDPAPEPVSLDFSALRDYVEGRLDSEREARMRETLELVSRAFRSVYEPAAVAPERRLEGVSSPAAAPVESPLPPVVEDQGPTDDEVVRVLTMPSFDNEVAVYISDRLGLQDRVRRVLDDTDESQSRYERCMREFESYSDEDMRRYALEIEPLPERPPRRSKTVTPAVTKSRKVTRKVDVSQPMLPGMEPAEA